MNAYTGLAGAYDAFTSDVDYRSWLRWYLRWFRRETVPVVTVLDLGCGTATLTCLLAEQGYDMIGVDASGDMLTEAMDKVLALPEEQRPLLLCQRMDALTLAGQVDAVVCSLDCLNYITSLPDLRRTLQRTAKFLRPGGLFLFDVIPVWEFARRDGQVFVDEDEGSLCLWRADWDRRRKVITYGLDLFQSDNGLDWSREQEEHQERGWELEQLFRLLEETGFSVLSCTGSSRKKEPCQQDDRVFFVCRKR